MSNDICSLEMVRRRDSMSSSIVDEQVNTTSFRCSYTIRREIHRCSGSDREEISLLVRERNDGEFKLGLVVFRDNENEVDNIMHELKRRAKK